jgi:sulfite reductase beta subunit-like hemoprotein
VEIKVGGGTSIMPRIAPTLYDFVGLDDGEYLEVAEAVFRIFDRQDWLRVNRARARIKVLVDKIGIDEFRKLVDEERQGDWVAERDFDVAGLRLDVDEEDRAPDVPDTYASPNGDGSDFERFRSSNVTAQRQEGFSAVQVHVPRGDLSPDQLRALADIARRYSGGWVRTTVHQNLLFRWVRNETVYEVWEALRELGLGDAGADQVGDVVSCPGTDSCKLGITSSMGLNAALRERLDAMQITDPLTRKLHIKMSGCPNGCSQHHIANIGFYGASIKVGEHTIPAYVAHIAGNYEGGEIVYGQRLKVRLPAKRVPEAVERWIRLYERDRTDGEQFNAFTARVGTTTFEDEVRDLALPLEFGLDTIEQFIDWERKVPFVVQRGEGECAV